MLRFHPTCFRAVSLSGLLVVACAVFGTAFADTAKPIVLPFGIVVTPQVSIGQLGWGLAILIQIGRWGRHTVARMTAIMEGFPEIVHRIERIEQFIQHCPPRQEHDPPLRIRP